MAFAISPIHTTEDFTYPLTLEQKIEVFVARVKGWQIQPAMALREKDVPHRGFAQLAIIMSYLEMIGKYKAGYIGDRESGKYFKEGMLYTFYDLPLDDVELLDAFYELIRNGLYHLGVTMPNVLLTDSFSPGSFAFNKDLRGLMISPDRFVFDIAIRFEVFVKHLNNPANESLRKNFEARFDYDNATRPSKAKAG